MCPFILAAALAVQAEPTPIDPLSLAAVLRDSHHHVAGHFPSKARLAGAVAQVGFESGKGAKSYCFNLGAVHSPKGPHFLIHGHKLGAFVDFIDAGRAYWRTVLRCSSAIRAFDDGVIGEAAWPLRRCGYHATQESVYRAGLVGLSGWAWRTVRAI